MQNHGHICGECSALGSCKEENKSNSLGSSHIFLVHVIAVATSNFEKKMEILTKDLVVSHHS